MVFNKNLTLALFGVIVCGSLFSSVASQTTQEPSDCMSMGGMCSLRPCPPGQDTIPDVICPGHGYCCRGNDGGTSSQAPPDITLPPGPTSMPTSPGPDPTTTTMNPPDTTPPPSR